MKKIKFLIPASSLLLLASACLHTETTTTVTTSLQTKETYLIHYPSDTLNFTDQYNRKQGMWLNVNSKDRERTLYKNDTAYPFTDSTIQDVIKMLNSKP